MHAAPRSWSARGRLAEDQRREQHRADRLERERDRRHDGGQPRQRDRDQQPAEHLRAEREQDQPALRRPARRPSRGRPQARPIERAADRRARASRRSSGPGRPDDAAAALPQRRAGSPSTPAPVSIPKTAPSGRVRAVRALLQRARDEDDADAGRPGSTTSDPRLGRSRSSSHASSADEHDLQCSRARSRAPAPTCSIALCQKIEVGGEERARDPGEVVRARGPRAELLPLPPGDDQQSGGSAQTQR